MRSCPGDPIPFNKASPVEPLSVPTANPQGLEALNRRPQSLEEELELDDDDVDLDVLAEEDDEAAAFGFAAASARFRFRLGTADEAADGLGRGSDGSEGSV